MSKLKLAWKDMNDDEKAIFGSRAKGPILTVLAIVATLGTSSAMMYVMGLL